MVIQYCSDLHLEFPGNKKLLDKKPLLPKGDVLLLGGDILPFELIDRQPEFFNWAADNFEQTYWLPGNHEYYYTDIKDKAGMINEAIRSNVFLVNNLSVQLDKVKLIFSTLWSQILPDNYLAIQSRMADFSLIHNSNKLFTPYDYNELHHLCKKFIANAINEKTDTATMVVTHHVPTFLNYPAKYKRDILNVAFATELHDLIEKSNIDYWQYGHHHFNTPTFTIGKTQLVTNQLGYIKYKENIGFKNDAVIEFL